MEQSLPFYQQGGYLKEAIQARQLLARAQVLRGEYDAALPLLEQVLQLSEKSGDPFAAGLAHEDIGLLFIKEGRYPEALTHFQPLYEVAKSRVNPKNLALSLIDRANVLWRLGRYDETRAALQEAAPIAEDPQAASNLAAAYYLAQARLALSERKFNDAQERAQQSIARDPLTAARFTLGFAQALLGSSGQGQLKLQDAVKMARDSGDPSIISEALLALAQAQIENRNAAGALANALEAQQIFAHSGKQDCEWLAWLIAALARSREDGQVAHNYALRAQELLNGLQQKWGEGNFATYFNRPDIQFSRKQLSELIAGKS
jgi:tetratricopeptide (TPR) repeat protein